jgi:hypothetical protein
MRIMWASFAQGTANNISETDTTDTGSTSLPKRRDGSEEAVDQSGNGGAASTKKPAARPPSYKTVDGKKYWVRPRESKFSEIEALIPKLRAAADYLNKREQGLPEKQLPSRKPTELFFDSATEAQFANADIIDHWAPPKSDLTIPTTHADKLALIRELVTAITSTSNCLTTNSTDAAYQER